MKFPNTEAFTKFAGLIATKLIGGAEEVNLPHDKTRKWLDPPETLTAALSAIADFVGAPMTGVVGGKDGDTFSWEGLNSA